MKRQQRALFFIFAIIFLGKLSAQIPVTDLKGYWPLEGNANDFSGNNNNGTVNGATLTSDRFNRANAAYQFSNATHTISILGSSTLNLGKPFTMSLWFYNNGSSQTLFRKGGEWGIDLDGTAGGNQRLAFFSSISNGSNIVKFTDYVVQPNKWYHVCAMFDQSTVKIYLDNVLILDEANSNLSSYSSTHQVTMGGYGPEPFYGKIDDVRIYSRALSPSEVASLYNDQPPVTNVTFRDDYPADGLRYCTGATYTTSDITVYGNFNAGNTISVQLLNPNGTLYSTQNVGYNYASAAANTIAIHIPSGVPSGSGYMFKIETSSPASEYIPNQTFEIYALNSPVISNPSPVNFCTGGSVSLNSTCDFSNIVYEWKKDAAPAGGYNNYNYPANYSATTSGYYSVVYYDQNGCTMQSNQVTVNALSNLAAPVITGNTTVCAGMSTTLDAGTGCASYLWSNGATTQTVSVGAGNYSVTVTNSNGCSVTSEITTVTSAQAPVAVITGEITVCPGTTSTLSATAGYTYLWSTGATTESVNVPAGTYSLTVTDTYGCSANQSLTVQNSTSCTAITSAYCGKEFKTTADNIYSNPVSGALSYEFIFDETNTVGQIFRTSPVITRSTNYINLSEVPFLHYNGNYLVRVRVVRSTGTSPWSAACTFTIIPGNSLYYACNSTYYTYNNMNATMVLRNVYGATKYNVTLVRVSDGVAVTSTDYTAAATSTSAVSYPLTSFTGLTYNTEYYSYVKTYVPYLENGVVTYKWSNPVQNCNVKINEPDNAFHYACNSAFYTYTYNNMNATMVLRNVYGATKYNVTLVRVSDGVAVTSTDYTTPATSTSAVSYPLTSFTGLTYNTEYYSYVKTYVPYLENGVVTYKWSNPVLSCNVKINEPDNAFHYACNSAFYTYTYNNMNATMLLRNVYGATKYNVTLVRVSDGVAVTSTDYTAAATSTGAVSYPLTSFTGLTYNTEYYSYVKTYVPYLENGVVTYKWSNPVQNCNVKINEPDNAFHYACNSAFYTYSYNNMNATMLLRNVYGATKYNVTLVRVSDGVAITSTDYTTPATSTSAVSYPLISFTGLTYNTEYYSYVKTYVPYMVNGVLTYQWSNPVQNCNVKINEPDNVFHYACNSTYYTYNNMNATMLLRNVYGATKYNVTLVRVLDGVAVTSTDYTTPATSTSAVPYPLTSFTGLTYNTEYYSYIKTYVPYMVNGVLTYQWSNPVQSCNVTILPGSGRIAGSNIGDNEEETAKVSPEVTLATYYQLNVYPNPSANTNVVVEMNENTISEISVCDASGKIIYKESNVNKNSSVLTTDTWKQGIYLVLVKHNNGISYRKLLIE